MAYEYQSDDLFFDLEVRGNFFVLSQYYPKQDKLVVSYLENINFDDFKHTITKTVTTATATKHASTPAKSQAPASAMMPTQEADRLARESLTKEPTNSKAPIQPQTITQTVVDRQAHEGFAQKVQLKKAPQDARTNNDVIVASNFTNNQAKIAEYIRKIVTPYHNTKIIFENLASLSGIAEFAKRYGYINNFSSSDDSNPVAYTTSWKPFKVIHDTDPDYKASAEYQGLRIGYNSQNYDQTVIAHLLGGVFKELLNSYQHFTANKTSFALGQVIDNLYKALTTNATPEALVNFNREVFMADRMPSALPYGSETDTYNAYKYSNRFVDVSQLNPMQISLKRLALMLGLNVMESDTNTDPRTKMDSLEDVAKLIAYNANDVHITQMVFEQGSYQARFQQNNDLLKRYPQLIYQHDDSSSEALATMKNAPDAYKHVRQRTPDSYDARMTVNTTSRNFIENVIAPYPNTKIKDWPTIKLVYPDNEVLQRAVKNGTAPKSISEYHHYKLKRDFIKALHEGRHFSKKYQEQIKQMYHTPMYKPVDVLDYLQFQTDKIKKYFTNDLQQPDKAKLLQAEFNKIKSFYEQFIGLNVNNSIDDINKRFNYAISTSLDEKEQERRRRQRDAQRDRELHRVFEDDTKPGQALDVPDYTDPSSSVIKQKNIFIRYITPDYDTDDKLFHDKHGNALASYVNFALGGTHGVELRQGPYDKALDVYQDKLDAREYIRQELSATDDDDLAHKLIKDRHAKFEFRGHTYTHMDFLKSGSTMKKPALRTFKKPQVFKGSKVNPTYGYTASGLSHHQDFSSYYPTLMSNMAIFRNPDGKDIFSDVYHDRLKYKALAKKYRKMIDQDKTGEKKMTDQERQDANTKYTQYQNLQLCMKLLINSASGGGAIGYESNIKCNNKTTAMRIIGQLFSWYIGQVLSAHKARIPSTNTDGLYADSIEEKLSNSLVEHASHDLLLEIGPEVIDNFISKDANNRLEYTDGLISNAKGGQLTSWGGPSTAHRLSHSAMTDHLLAFYLAKAPDSVNRPFDRKFAAKLLDDFLNDPAHDIPETLRYLQFPVVGKADTFKYPYLVDSEGKHPEMLNQTNRVIPVKSSSTRIRMTGVQVMQAKSIHKQWLAQHPETKKVPDLTNTRFADIIADQSDLTAMNILRLNLHESQSQFNQNTLLAGRYNPHATKVVEKPRKIINIKITGFPEDQPVDLLNHDLHDITPEQYDKIIANLDKKFYIDTTEDAFTSAWQNPIPKSEQD